MNEKITAIVLVLISIALLFAIYKIVKLTWKSVTEEESYRTWDEKHFK